MNGRAIPNAHWYTCPLEIHEIAEDSFIAQHSFPEHRNVLGVSATTLDETESLLIAQEDEATAQRVQAGEMMTAGLPSLDEASG